MSLWLCDEHGLYGGQVFCPKCGGTGGRVTLAFCGSSASGIETEGRDHEDGHGAEHESPTAESGDAQTPSSIT